MPKEQYYLRVLECNDLSLAKALVEDIWEEACQVGIDEGYAKSEASSEDREPPQYTDLD